MHVGLGILIYMTHIGRQSMKSIVEEASSIVKAIEKAWERAGKPQEFTVKVFEDAERGFLGMTKKPAKVGIFFTQTQTIVERARDRKPAREQRVVYDRQPARGREEQLPPRPKVAMKNERRPAWTEEMSGAVETWLIQLTKRSGLEEVSFAVARMGNRLHITFKKTVFETQGKNTALFRSLSYLLLGMLRSRFKKEFRFLKIVLTTDQPPSHDEYR